MYCKVFSFWAWNLYFIGYFFLSAASFLRRCDICSESMWFACKFQHLGLRNFYALEVKNKKLVRIKVSHLFNLPPLHLFRAAQHHLHLQYLQAVCHHPPLSPVSSKVRWVGCVVLKWVSHLFFFCCLGVNFYCTIE